MAGHVYLIGSRKFHWFKIGKSSNATIRIADLGILLPFRIEVIAVWRAENHHEVERLLHEKYSAHHVNGEWFTFSDRHLDAVALELQAVKIDAALGFCNIPKEYSEPAPSKKSSNGGSVTKKIARLVKEKYALQERLKLYEPEVIQ